MNYQDDASTELGSAYVTLAIEVLPGVEAARRRPGMYVGDTQRGSGLHQLVWELLANAIDQHLGGRCSTISLTLAGDGSVAVEDNGPGISVEAADGAHRSFLENACTQLHHRATLDGHTPHVHVSLFGVGMAVVNALSARFVVETVREGQLFQLACERGVPLGPLRRLGPTSRRGTRVTVWPDPSIFASVTFDRRTIVAKLREVMFLNPSLELHLVDGRHETFSAPGGLVDFIPLLRGDAQPVHEVLALNNTIGGIKVELALQWCTRGPSDLRSYVNMTPTREGGTHVRGLRSALMKVVLAHAKRAGRKASGGGLTERLLRGLCGVVAIEHHDPSYDGPTKSLLASKDAGSAVGLATEALLGEALEADRRLARHLVALAYGTGGR